MSRGCLGCESNDVRTFARGGEFRAARSEPMFLATKNAEYVVADGVCTAVNETGLCPPSHRQHAVGMALYGSCRPGVLGLTKGIVRVGCCVVFTDNYRMVCTSPLVAVRSADSPPKRGG